MKEYTESEFAAVVNECAAEVAEMLKPKPKDPPKEKGWRRCVVGILRQLWF